MQEIRKEIKKIALQNAFEHGGETRVKIVLGKILGTHSEFRTRVQEISVMISEIVDNTNQLTTSELLQEIKDNFPEILLPKEKPTDSNTTISLPNLKNAEHGKVVTRFPPEPNGYPHIGHAKAAIINSEYAKMYNGKFILRLDDTNPEAERMEYHAAIKVGLEWLGIKIDKVKNTSDDMEIFYEKAVILIQSENAYTCTCKRDSITKNRRERKSCKCSKQDNDKNMKYWNKMIMGKFKQGDAILRFRGDMQADNAVMRDPVLFRIIDEKHYIHGKKYRVWPSYDMSVAIEDSIDGVTHALRSKEFELRAEIIRAILNALNMRIPNQGFFSRLEFKGMPISKRVIKPLIDEGKISWYDDPRLPTLEALKRRGIKPDAIRKFIMSLGFTKADTLAPFDALEAFNRKLIDSTSARLFMVSKAKRLKVNKLPFTFIEIPNHPANKNMGKRTIELDDNLYISGEDAQEIKKGIIVRLLGLGNVLVTRVGIDLEGDYVNSDIDSNCSLKIQWVAQKSLHKIKLIIPKMLFNDNNIFNEQSLQEINGYTESQYMQLKDGDPIQFVRCGYFRKDSQAQAIFTHK